MSRVITYATKFPPYHPRGGEPTYFVEKIWTDLNFTVSYKLICDLNPNVSVDIIWAFWQSIKQDYFNSKGHTIRSGHRFKVGDWFSPRVWSGIPYRSKQIIIAPDIQVKKVWDVEIDELDIWAIGLPETQIKYLDDRQQAAIARNDGLSEQDLYWWFKEAKKPFIGQVICWNEKVKY